MNDEKDLLGTQPVGKLLMRLALPTVTAQIINMLYNIVDRIYIGHIPDVGALALTVFSEQKSQHPGARHGLGDNRRQSRAPHAQMQGKDKDRIQNDMAQRPDRDSYQL